MAAWLGSAQIPSNKNAKRNSEAGHDGVNGKGKSQQRPGNQGRRSSTATMAARIAAVANVRG